MLETSVVRFQTRSRWRNGLLPLSLAVHIAAIGAVVFASVWTVTLPDVSPSQLQIYSPLQTPPMPPSAPPAQPQQKSSAEPPREARAGDAAAAPAVVPEVIPELEPPQQRPGVDPHGLPSELGGSGAPGLVGRVGDGPVVSGEAERDASRIFVVGGDVRPPVRITGAQPHYPPLAQRSRVQGSVTIECVIDPGGAVTDARIVRSSHQLLESGVLEGVRSWRFRPGTLNGRPVNTRFELTVVFKLQ
jgi:periplasmic protein TonB